MRKRRWLVGEAVLVVFMSLVAPASAQSAGRAAMPFTFVDNRMVVECKIDGHGPFAIIVDTGAPDVTITPETAAQVGVTVRKAGTLSGAGNAKAAFGTTHLRAVSIGPLSFQNVDATVLDLSEIRTKLGFPHLDGIVGYAVLRKFQVLVDVDAGALTFATGPLPIPANATNTAFAIDGDIPVIAARIDGIDTTVLVDTGDRSSLTVFGPFAKRHGLYGRYPSRANVVTGYGIGGPVYADVFTLPTLDVLGTHFTGIVTRASRQTGGVFASASHGGSVGEGLLKRFNIVYDYPRSRVIAWPSRYFAVANPSSKGTSLSFQTLAPIPERS